MSYVISVGGDPVNPNPFTYSQISMTENITLIWPSNTADATYTATNWIDITSSVSSLIVMLPAANEAPQGAEIVFYNYGSNTITINDADGGNITTIASGETKRIWITDASTVAGTWRIANIGSGTTSADASMLAGYGLIAQSGQLSQSMQVSSFSTDIQLNAGVRSYLIKWTGGAGTFTLDAPSTLANNWFVNVKNAGSGTLNIDANGAQIDGTTDIDVAPEQGFTIVTDGVNFFTIGRIIPETSGLTLLSKSVAGSMDVTLTSSESAYNIIYFTGVLTGNINVIVPSSVNEWVMFNNTSGAYTLTVKTSGGTGVVITQSTRRILNCDGTNVNFSDTVGSGSVTSVATGTGLTGGPITTTGIVSLANTAVISGTYTLMSATIDAQGRITDASNGSISVVQQLRTPTTAGSTLELQAYDVDGASYTTFITLTANNTPTADLSSGVTKGGAYIYVVGGTDVAVTDGGTGLGALTLNNIILGNGTSSPSFLAPGTSGNVATSNGTTWVSSAAAVGPFTLSFQSSAVTLVAGAGTIAHGLGGRPKIVYPYLRCKTAELNYAIGDEVLCPWQTNGFGINTFSSGTANIGYAIENNIRISNATTNTDSDITYANWEYFVRAYR